MRSSTKTQARWMSERSVVDVISCDVTNSSEAFQFKCRAASSVTLLKLATRWSGANAENNIKFANLSAAIPRRVVHAIPTTASLEMIFHSHRNVFHSAKYFPQQTNSFTPLSLGAQALQITPQMQKDPLLAMFI
ncbi:unnamed protein product [Pieris macdunnoughi]|uniref:Uncharacterized protein n=1 Tax=Pieris macdunnoughi TaxID=345717 RepID=A0A821URN8_9NEOP|nr:unnamed protein product [Pieris macdunnoughi]